LRKVAAQFRLRAIGIASRDRLERIGVTKAWAPARDDFIAMQYFVPNRVFDPKRISLLS